MPCMEKTYNPIKMNNQHKMNITDYFFDAAKKHPDKAAIIEVTNSISFGQLAQEVKNTAQYLEERGIQSGDRVMVFVPMSIDLYRITLALFYIGATAVFLDAWASRERLKMCCRLAQCKAFVGTPKAQLLRIATKEIRQIPIHLSIKGRGQRQHPGQRMDREASALITFTTGSTGLPKAADRTHLFLMQQFEVLKEKLQCHHSDVAMPMLPIVLFINLGVGATSVIADYNARKPEKMSAAKVIKQLISHKINRITASPFVIKRIAQHLLDTKTSLPYLHQVSTGGAPVFPEEAKIYQRALPNTRIEIIYGSTEAEPISSIAATELSQLKVSGGLAVGDVHPDTALRILSIENKHQHKINLQDFESSVVTEGEIGEIVVSGDHVLKKYFNNSEAFRENKIIVDSQVWHRTGDSGYIQDGNLYLTGRCAQLIKREDRYLSPFVIENRIKTLGNGNKIGTIIEHTNGLYLVVEKGINLSELETYFMDLEYDTVVQVNKIPRDPRHYSKIDYNKLKAQLPCTPKSYFTRTCYT